MRERKKWNSGSGWGGENILPLKSSRIICNYYPSFQVWNRFVDTHWHITDTKLTRIRKKSVNFRFFYDDGCLVFVRVLHWHSCHISIFQVPLFINSISLIFNSALINLRIISFPFFLSFRGRTKIYHYVCYYFLRFFVIFFFFNCIIKFD